MDYKLLKLIALAPILAFLTACSSIYDKYREFAPDRDTAYLDADANHPLVLPEGVEMMENYHSPYIIPAGELPGPDAEPMNLVPPGGQALWDRAKVEEARAEQRAQEAKEEEDDE